MTVRGLVRTFSVVAVLGLALTACRAEEQGRILRYEPGVYKGKPDTQLSEAQVRALRERSLQQSGATGTGGGGGASGPKKGTDVRPPSVASDLNTRARLQGGAQ